MAWGLLAFGLAIGFLSGMTGIGGGVLLVPGLVLLFGLSQTEAQGTSLAVLMLPVVAFAVMVYYQNGFIRVFNVTFIAGGFAAGAFVGAKLVPHVPIHWLRCGLGLLLLYVAMLFVFDAGKHPVRAALPAGAALLLGKLWSLFLKPHHHSSAPSAIEFDREADYHI
jgi:uncharacterized protein